MLLKRSIEQTGWKSAHCMRVLPCVVHRVHRILPRDCIGVQSTPSTLVSYSCQPRSSLAFHPLRCLPSGTLIIFEAVTSRAVWFSMFMAPPTLTRTCVGCHDLPRRFVDISIHAFESYIIKLLANPVTYCGRDGISCTTSYHYSNTKFETSRYAKLPVEISLVLAQSRFSCIDNMVGYTTGHASCPNMW